MQKMPKNFSASLIKDLPRLSGTYAFYSPQGTCGLDNSQNFCIGSATDYATRLNNHYADSSKPRLALRPLYAEVHRVGG